MGRARHRACARAAKITAPGAPQRGRRRLSGRTHDVVCAARDNFHVGLRRHLLLLGGQVVAVLVHKVAQRARHGEVAVDAPHRHRAARRLDAPHLAGVVRLVVVGHFLHGGFAARRRARAAAHEHGPRVAAVGANDVRRRHHHRNGRAAAAVVAVQDVGVLREKKRGKRVFGEARLKGEG